MKISVIIILFFTAACVFSQQAVIQNLAGTVEVKFTGSEIWERASLGQTLSGNTTISTGLRSTAVISVGSSTLTVRPLTRLTIVELIQLESTEKVELALQVGRVRSDVNPPPGGKVEFTVRSSSATASVRGTTFEFDTLNIAVSKGTVEFAGNYGTPYMIDAVGYSRIRESTNRAVNPKTTVIDDLKPSLPIASETSNPETRPVDQNPQESDHFTIPIITGY